jgi:hypothetical protein
MQCCENKQELCSLNIDSAVKLVENTHDGWVIVGMEESREGKIYIFVLPALFSVYDLSILY